MQSLWHLHTVTTAGTYAIGSTIQSVTQGPHYMEEFKQSHHLSHLIVAECIDTTTNYLTGTDTHIRSTPTTIHYKAKKPI